MKNLILIAAVTLLSQSAFASTILCEKEVDGVTHTLEVNASAFTGEMNYKYETSEGLIKIGGLNQACYHQTSVKISKEERISTSAPTTILGQSESVCRATTHDIIKLVVDEKFKNGKFIHVLEEFSFDHQISAHVGGIEDKPLQELTAIAGAVCQL